MWSMMSYMVPLYKVTASDGVEGRAAYDAAEV